MPPPPPPPPHNNHQHHPSSHPHHHLPPSHRLSKAGGGAYGGGGGAISQAPSGISSGDGVAGNNDGANNEADDDSPSASTISTKASLLAPADGRGRHHLLGAAAHHRIGHHNHHHHHPRGEQQQHGGGGAFFGDHHPPTPNMKPKHPVHVKKSREDEQARQGDAKRRKLGALGGETSPDKEHQGPSPTGSSSSSSDGPAVGTSASNGGGASGHAPLDGRVMSESPAAHSLAELGAVPSWETAGKPLAGWSVCSGMTEMGSLGRALMKDSGVLGTAFSFSEGFKREDEAGAGGGVGGGGGGDNEARDDGGGREEMEDDDDDPSPKSILSKEGERRRNLAPGTHVQFSRASSYPDLESVAPPPSSSAVAGGGPSRKRDRREMAPKPGPAPIPAPPSTPPSHSDYYYDYPRPYDYPSRPGPPIPPPGGAARHHHPREHGYYPEEADPYYDPYYAHHPHHPPPPYGYPPARSRHRGPPPPHYPSEYPPHYPHHRPLGGRAAVSTVHTPPSSSTRSAAHPHPHAHLHHPHMTPGSQFSHLRGASGGGLGGGSSGAGGGGMAGWDKESDAALIDIMKKFKNPKSWEPIAKKLGRGKSPRECQERWTRFLKPGSRKGQWTDEEDAIVADAVRNSLEDPFTRWSDLASKLPGRVGKQVRDRWVNHLNPAINHLPFSREDDLLLWEGHHVLGKRWVEISTKYFKGARSENHIKNRWYSASFKKFIAKEFGQDAYRIGNEAGGDRNAGLGSVRKAAAANVVYPAHHQQPPYEGEDDGAGGGEDAGKDMAKA